MENEERKSVLEEAHLLIQDDSTESRRSIINIFLEISVKERKFLIDQALELITDDTSDEEKEELIRSLSQIPQEERQAIINEASRLIVEDMNSDYKLFIIMILSKVSQEERKSILDHSRLLLIDNTPDENKPGIIDSLSKLDQNERKTVVDETLLLFKNDKSPQSICRVFRLLVELPSRNRSLLTNQALRLTTDRMLAEDRESIIEFLMQVPSDQIESVTTQALRLITDTMSVIDKMRIIKSLKQVLLNQIESVTTQVLGLITDPTSVEEIVRIINFFRIITNSTPSRDREIILRRLRQVALEQVEGLTTQALRLSTDCMSPLDKLRIINSLEQLPTQELEFLTTQALRLATNSMSSPKIVAIIDFLLEIPLENTESLITQILCLITDRMSPNDIIDLLEFFRRIPLDNIESLITEALRLITDDMNCADKQNVISYLGSLTKNEREFLIMQALHLSSGNIAGEDRVELIASLYENFDDYKFITNSEEIIQNPIKVIINLYEKLDNSYIGLLPSSIEYNDNSEVIDDGGVTRSFVATLTKSFCNSDYSLVKNSEIGVIPTLVEKEAQLLSIKDQERCFKVIGRFFSSALQGYTSIVLGQYFHPIVFEMIHTLNSEDFANYNSSQVFDKMLKIWIVKELNVPEDYAEALVQDNIMDELRDVYCIDSKDEFVNEHQIDNKIRAVFIIAKSMYDSLLDKVEWSNLKGHSGDSLRKKIQGTISRDRIKSALQGDEMDIVDENSFQLIKKWITGANSEELEKFIEAISGMKTLSSITKLNIAGVNGFDKLPQFHTCFFRMDLSQYSSYEAFKEKLEMSLDYCLLDSGFQMA